MAGDWDCEDLTSLVRLLLRDRPAMMAMEGGIARLSAPLRAQLHRARRNDRAGSRRNIAAHYDLGNDFYRLWLDETLMYSSAIFERPDMTLAEASTAKLERICRKLALKPGDEVLEIGTGWGGFALHAAGRHFCRVTSLTLSQVQLALARERVAAAGLTELSASAPYRVYGAPQGPGRVHSRGVSGPVLVNPEQAEGGPN